MFEHLTEHTRREGAMLSEYAAIAETTESKALQYVINLLLEDERRHHRYFNELAASLKSEAELSADDPVVPRLDLDRVERLPSCEPRRIVSSNTRRPMRRNSIVSVRNFAT